MRAQGVLGRLLPIRSRNQHREEGILGCLVLKMGAQADARNRVHKVAEIDPLVGSDARQIADRLALGPFDQGFRASLAGRLETVGHVLL